MHRPLWQILLTIFVLSFVVQRAGAAAMLYLSDAPPALLAGFALQIGAALATALGLWLGRRWVVGALLLLGVAVVATAIFGAFYLRVVPAPVAISQALVAAVASGALALVLRREFGGPQRAPDGLARQG